MEFKLKRNRKFMLRAYKGDLRIISNVTMNSALALEFLSVNTEYRKSLFEWIPEDVDERISEYTKNWEVVSEEVKPKRRRKTK